MTGSGKIETLENSEATAGFAAGVKWVK